MEGCKERPLVDREGTPVGTENHLYHLSLCNNNNNNNNNPTVYIQTTLHNQTVRGK
jgi:hypothetical protein